MQETEQMESTGTEIPELTDREETEKTAEPENPSASAADTPISDWRQNRDAGALARVSLKKEARRRREEERQETARRRKEERLQKEQQRQAALDLKLRTKQEKKDRRMQDRQERRREVRFLWRTVEFVMLVTFIALAIDQAGLYGFLFVWLFIAVAAASVVLMLAGVIRALAKKRTGLILLTGLIGIIASAAWFLFLASSRGIGIF